MRARPGSALVALVATATIGCGFGADYGGTGYQCGEGQSCPSGFDCVDGFCRAGGPDGAPVDGELDDGGDPDAGDTDGGGAWQPSGCGNLSLLQDDFSDGIRGREWDNFGDPGVTIDEIGGHLEIELAAGSGEVFGGYRANPLHDLTGGALEATVTQVGGVDTILEIRAFDGARAQLVVEDGVLTASVFNVPDAGTRAEIPYVPAEHRHWRMREDNGSLYWETSPDRSPASWTTFYSELLPFPAADVFGIVSAGGQLGAVSTARFDDVNGDAPASLRYCPTSTFVDDFDAAPLEPAWDSWEDPGCTLTETGGDLRFDIEGDDGVSFCGVESRHLFDLRGSEVIFDAGGVGDVSTLVTYVEVFLARDDQSHLEIAVEQDYLAFAQVVDGANTDSTDITFDRVDHRYWRIAESGGVVTFSTSANATDWDPQLTAGVAFDLSVVQVMIAAGVYGAGPGFAVETEIRSINAP